jgi:hypothetical protein
MNLMLYIPATGEAQEWMHTVLERVPTKVSAELFRSIGSFSRRLRRPVEGLTIAVLVVGNKEDLANIILIRDLLSEIPIILILPDRAAENTAAGFGLVPRFLTYADGDKAEVGAVLAKMFANYKKKSKAFQTREAFPESAHGGWAPEEVTEPGRD